jgi:hypothetical protein
VGLGSSPVAAFRGPPTEAEDDGVVPPLGLGRWGWGTPNKSPRRVTIEAAYYGLGLAKPSTRAISRSYDSMTVCMVAAFGTELFGLNTALFDTQAQTPDLLVGNVSH